MREYFGFFKIPLIAVGVLAAVTVVLFLTKGTAASSSVSGNTERTTTERVFDYADKLTDSEEEALREMIQAAETETQCDIVLVTLNESLAEYAAQYEDILGPVSVDEYVMVYADNFYDEHKFGYDEAYGNGVLFLDNEYREADGWIYSWMSTSGKAEERYTSSMIDRVMNDVFSYVEDDPYTAYAAFVEDFSRDMTDQNDTNITGIIFQPMYILIAAFIIAIVFLVINWSSKRGKRTTTNRTYVVGGNPHFRLKEDRFLYKNVTKHKIANNSSSGSGGIRGGGGGHHMSAGGRSHGGGGGRR